MTPGGYVGHYSSFILRLWVEPPEGVRWGIIQHVATRDKLRFQASNDNAIAVADVIEFIRLHSAEGEISLPFALDGSETSAAGSGGGSGGGGGNGKEEASEPQQRSEAGTPESQL